jgi:hypothetical protein
MENCVEQSAPRRAGPANAECCPDPPSEAASFGPNAVCCLQFYCSLNDMMPKGPSRDALAALDRLDRGEFIPWEEFISWMQSGDLELEALAFAALTCSPTRVVGSIDIDVANNFFFRYLLASLSQQRPPAQILGDSRLPYIDAYEIAARYTWLRLQGTSPHLLESVRDELARLYLSGDADLKDQVVNGALEHILEEPLCREDFKRWRLNPELSQALSEALKWSERS